MDWENGMTLTDSTRRKIVILGGGVAGMAVFTKLHKVLRYPHVTLVEASTTCQYPPFLPLVGVGAVRPEEAEREIANFLPSTSSWVRDQVKKIDTKTHTVVTEGGREIPFEFLVVCPSLIHNPKDVKGMDDLIAEGHVHSTHDLASAQRTYKALDGFSGGAVVVATHAMGIRDDFSQTMLHLIDDFLRDRGLHTKSTLIFATAGEQLFPQDEIHKTLAELASSKGIEVMLAHKLQSVDPEAKEVTFAPLDEKGKPKKDETVTLPYDLLHFTPEMVPPKVISGSRMVARRGDFKGWLNVDPHTLQGKEPNIFGLGSITNLPIPSSMEAIEAQASVLVHNLVATLQGRGPYTFETYDGHTSLPLLLGHNEVLKAGLTYHETPDKKGNPEVDGMSLTEPPSQSGLLWLFFRHIAPRLFWRRRLKRR